MYANLRVTINPQNSMDHVIHCSVIERSRNGDFLLVRTDKDKEHESASDNLILPPHTQLRIEADY